MDRFKEIINKAKSGWKNMEPKRRGLMVGTIIGLILLVFILGYMINRTDYVTLFTNLSYEDAGTIVNDLESKNIKYKLEDDGKRIDVDAKRADKYRLELAMEGNLPDDGSGFEIFDDIGMMATDDDRKIMYQRALEGEIQRSIMSLDAVKLAKVHLVMSESSIFETQEKPASASVILELNKGQDMGNETIDGIVSLLAGAVENLPKENVKVIDSQGNVLSNRISEDGDGGNINAASKYQQIKLDFEDQMERNLLALLEDVLGRGKVKIKVNADLDFDAEESTIISYEDPVVRSEQIIVSGDDIDVEGEDALIGDNPSNLVGRITGEDAHYDKTTNNELSSETTNIIRAPGRINRMTTSVVYDGDLSNRQTEQIERMVATATGYDFDRDDLISIVGIEFDKSEEEALQAELDQMRQEEEEKAKMETYRNIALMAVASALVLTIIIAIVRRARKDRQTELALEEAMMVAEEEEAKKGREEQDLGIRAQEEQEPAEPIQVTMGRDEERAKTYAKEHPELAADLIKAWLKDK